MIVAAAVLLAVGALLFTLLVRAKDLPPAPGTLPFAYLDEVKARIYDNLRDLQFEHRVGKLSDGDYQKTKLELQKELAGVMAQIDRVNESPETAPAPKPVTAPAPQAAGTCPHCGTKFERPLKFCGECGKPMAGSVS